MHKVFHPQNSQLFILFFFTVATVVLLYINISFLFSNNFQPDTTVSNVLQHPYNPSFHADLARIFWINGLTNKSANESAIAMDLSGELRDPNVLGATAINGVNLWRKQSFEQISGYIYWKTLADSKTDYLSAQIMTMYYSILTGKIAEAHEYYDRAFAIDPTNVNIQLLAPFVTRIP